MSYKKVIIDTLGKTQTAVQLDSGEFVALSCEILRDGGNSLALHAMATVITAGGDPVLDKDKVPWTAEMRHACDQYSVDTYGVPALIRECFLLLLGEPLTPRRDHPEQKIIDWSPEIVSSVSIRRTLDVAAAVAPMTATALSAIL